MRAEFYKRIPQVLKYLIVLCCICGFCWQTSQFLDLYWSYPTAVDIQVIVPTEVDIPAITFCDHNGYNLTALCEITGTCYVNGHQPGNVSNVCDSTSFPELCAVFQQNPSYLQPDDLEELNPVLNFDFKMISYSRVTTRENTATDMIKMRLPIQNFVTCTIISEGNTTDCKMDDFVIGSYYSDSFLFHYCYTINSLWAQPDKPITKIRSNEKISLKFVSSTSTLSDQGSVSNPPGSPAIQFLVHSPYAMGSPFSQGSLLYGGKNFEIKLTMEEKHLLPAPYQTNCTDYFLGWKARGGVGPLNQQMLLEECKKNKSLEFNSCVSFDIDYPHNDSVCKFRGAANTYNFDYEIYCTKLLEQYSQPCFSQDYIMDVEEELIDVVIKFKHSFVQDGMGFARRRKGYECEDEKQMFLNPKCRMVNVSLNFANFKITNTTYNAKIEGLELLSGVGGFLGMYLGASILTAYDFFQLVMDFFYRYFTTKKKNNKIKSHNTNTQKRSAHDARY